MTIISRIIPAFRYLLTGETPLPDDGRPMHADMFLAGLLSTNDLDSYDCMEAIDAWCHGDWNYAISFLCKDTDGDSEDDDDSDSADEEVLDKSDSWW